VARQHGGHLALANQPDGGAGHTLAARQLRTLHTKHTEPG
jgi:hypothetical protein